jgi:ABC-2 type transport system permease protein
MDRIRTIIDKEWAEVFKNRLVLFTVIGLPLIFAILPLVVLRLTASGLTSGDTVDTPLSLAQACQMIPGITGKDCLNIYLVNQFLILFMIMPVMIPITIAAYSIVGEKTTRSLEPLLATPISTIELLVGKALAATIPAVLATWGSFGLFILLLPITGASSIVVTYITGPIWLLATLLIGPLMAVLAVNFSIIISSRVNDPRVAEQLSAVLLVPILLVMFGQIGGIIILNVQLMLVAALIFVLVDLGAIYIGAKLFQRETILTRWK